MAAGETSVVRSLRAPGCGYLESCLFHEMNKREDVYTVYIYIHIHTYIHTYIYTNIDVYTHIVCVCTCILYVYIYIWYPPQAKVLLLYHDIYNSL
jgi:hypothetical protein